MVTAYNPSEEERKRVHELHTFLKDDSYDFRAVAGSDRQYRQILLKLVRAEKSTGVRFAEDTYWEMRDAFQRALREMQQEVRESRQHRQL